ncbi:hypothetical protein ABFA25_05195 [Mycobacterium lepromatosis]
MMAFGKRVQEAGAGIVSLGGLYADPKARCAVPVHELPVAQ